MKTGGRGPSVINARGFKGVLRFKEMPLKLFHSYYRTFSHDVRWAFKINRIAAMMVSQTSPVGVELFLGPVYIEVGDPR